MRGEKPAASQPRPVFSSRDHEHADAEHAVLADAEHRVVERERGDVEAVPDEQQARRRGELGERVFGDRAADPGGEDGLRIQHQEHDGRHEQHPEHEERALQQRGHLVEALLTVQLAHA